VYRLPMIPNQAFSLTGVSLQSAPTGT